MARNRKYQSAAIRFGPTLKALLLCLLIGGSGVGYVWQKDQIYQLGQQIRKRELYERHGVREYWLIHPIGRVLTVYRLIESEYGKPELYELRGKTAVGVLPDIVIQWDDLVTRLPKDY